MKKIYMFGFAVLLAAVLVLPGAAHSAMWVGGELGANFIGTTDSKLSVTAPGFNASGTSRVKFDNPTVIGGLTIGYDFVNTGFGGYAYPDWMKYFSLATDFTYNRMDIRSVSVNLSGSQVLAAPPATLAPVAPMVVPVNFTVAGRAEGYMAAWTFLFMAHYGFLPDSEVPAGRLHPYVGVGPCVLFSGLNIPGFGSQSSTDIALVAEGGIRFMALKNVSLDLAFRYRYANPSYEFGGSAFGVPASVKVEPTVNSYSILTRVSYHF